MVDHPVVPRDEWLAARRALLAKEKEFTQLRDELSRQRRALPWVRVERAYLFDTPKGRKSLAQLFEGRSQLIVYHFMFGPDWDAGCRSCSFWADSFNGITAHLNQRDVTFVAVSRAPLRKLQAFATRLGWTFDWVSSLGNDFNFDFGVSFTPEVIASKRIPYNYALHQSLGAEMPGISVFFRDRDEVLHTYSCYARGLDMLNTAYHYLDLTPRGRGEEGLSYTMEWVRIRDEYGSGSSPA